MKTVIELPGQMVEEEEMSVVTYVNRQVTVRSNVPSQKINYTANGVTKRSITVTHIAKDRWIKRRRKRKVQNKTVPTPKRGKMSRQGKQ